MIFDTLAAMADWLNDKKFNDNATESQVGEAVNGVDVSDIAAAGAAVQTPEEARQARIFANAMQSKTPRSALEDSLGSSSSSSSSNSSSSSQNFDPTGLKLTVTGASGTVTWGGRTWNLPADSGKSKTLTLANSPNLTFARGTHSGATTISAYDRISYWDYPAQTFPTIVLRRDWSIYSTTLISAANRVTFRNLLSDATPQTTIGDFKHWYAAGVTAAPPWGTTSTVRSDLGMILSVSAPNRNNYLVDDNFFGSYTNGGITYTWEKVV